MKVMLKIQAKKNKMEKGHALICRIPVYTLDLLTNSSEQSFRIVFVGEIRLRLKNVVFVIATTLKIWKHFCEENHFFFQQLNTIVNIRPFIFKYFFRGCMF